MVLLNATPPEPISLHALLPPAQVLPSLYGLYRHLGPMKMAPKLLELPSEVLHGILGNTNPQDLARLCCCRTLYDFIKNDQLLYKELYLRNFVKMSPKLYHCHSRSAERI